MKLKNSALQELYDTIFGGGTVTFTVDEESPIDKVFRECDEKLSESITFAKIKNLQNRNNILERSNKALLEANMESISKTRKLEKEIEEMQKDCDEYFDLYTKLRKDYDKLFEENRRLKIPGSIDYERAMRECDDLKKALMDAKTTLVKANADRTNLQEAVDKLSGENRSLNARIDCIREEVNWYRKHYKEKCEKIWELKARLNSMCGDKYLNKLLNSARDDGYESGQNDLWDKLKEVSDYYYFGGDDEFDTDDCEMTSMTDIIDNLNVNQFLEAYKNWHKVQERPWECTIEGTIKINGDLLNKVCGIDPDD